MAQVLNERTNERTNERKDAGAIVFVMVPRAKFAEYWPKPWAEVVGAAETGVDDLCVEGPHWTPMITEPPRADRYKDVTKYERDVVIYARQMNVAFLRDGDSIFNRGKSLLFQQNW